MGGIDGVNLNDGANETEGELLGREEGSRDGIPLDDPMGPKVGREDGDSLIAPEGFDDGVKLGSIIGEIDTPVTLTSAVFRSTVINWVAFSSLNASKMLSFTVEASGRVEFSLKNTFPMKK